jgi:hypothetical protein
MRSWTADGDNVFVTELGSAAGSAPVTITIDLAMPNNATYPFTSGVTNGALWVTRTNNQPGYVAQVAIAAGLVATPFASTAPGASASSGDLTLNPGQTAYLVAVVRCAVTRRGLPSPPSAIRLSPNGRRSACPMSRGCGTNIEPGGRTTGSSRSCG